MEKRIGTRGHTKRGIVVSDRAKKTVTVEFESTEYFPKYQRYARSRSRLPAHNPDEISAKLGDFVEIAECRKISKTKSWIVTKILKRAEGIVVLEEKGGRALEEEAERLKKMEVKREEAKTKPEGE